MDALEPQVVNLVSSSDEDIVEQIEIADDGADAPPVYVPRLPVWNRRRPNPVAAVVLPAAPAVVLSAAPAVVLPVAPAVVTDVVQVEAAVVAETVSAEVEVPKKHRRIQTQDESSEDEAVVKANAVERTAMKQKKRIEWTQACEDEEDRKRTKADVMKELAEKRLHVLGKIDKQMQELERQEKANSEAALERTKRENRAARDKRRRQRNKQAQLDAAGIAEIAEHQAAEAAAEAAPASVAKAFEDAFGVC